MGGETILLVEDEVLVRNAFARGLTGLGYRVLAAESVGSALDAVAALTGPLDLVITDLGIPGGGGLMLIDRLRIERPEARFLVISGQSSDAMGRKKPRGFGVLEKPFTLVELSDRLAEMLQGRGID